MRKLSDQAKSLLSGERGSAMLLTGITMVLLVGFTAIALDGGYMYFRHTQIQDIADASALAAAYQLIKAPGTLEDRKLAAFDAAVKCAQRNGLTTSSMFGTGMDITLGDESGRMTVTLSEAADEARVDITLDARTLFARVLLIDTTSIRVEATAEIIRVDGSDENVSLVPLAFFQSTYKVGTKVAMTLAPGEGVRGNYGFLDFQPSNMFRDYLAGGYPGTVTMGDVVETLPGVRTGQVRTALADRIAGCTHGCSIVDLDGDNDGDNLQINVTEPCPRVVTLPAVAGFYEAHGRSYVTVTGFVKLLIESYNEDTKVLTGWILGQVAPGDFTSTEGLALRSARLR